MSFGFSIVMTLSPGEKRVTCRPTARTVPAPSEPGTTLGMVAQG